MKRLFAFVLFSLSTGAWGFPHGGSGPPAPGGDGITALLTEMSSGQFVQLNNETAGGGGSLDMFYYAYPALSAKDGGHTWDSASTAGVTPGFAPMLGIGCTAGSSMNNCLAYSRAELDRADFILGYFGGGHNGGGDGSFVTHDLQAAAQAIATYVSGGGSFATANAIKTHLLVAIPSARYIPSTNANVVPSASQRNSSSGGVVSTTLGTWTAGTNTVTVNDCTYANFGAGYTFIGGAGIADYTYISHGCVGSAGGNTITIHNTYLPDASALSANGNNTPLNMNSGEINYWAVANVNGDLMPISSHSYANNIWIRGTSKIVLGGTYGFSNPISNFALHYSVADAKTGALFVSLTAGFNYGWGSAQSGAAYCPVDGNYYSWDESPPGSYHLSRIDSIATAGMHTSLFGLASGPIGNTEAIIIDDPWNPGHCALVEINGPDSGGIGTFGIITSIDNVANAAFHTATYDASLLTGGPKNRALDWDGTQIVGWDGSSAIIGITPSTGSTWAVNRISAASPTGNVPNVDRAQDFESNKIWDTGAAHNHALILWTGAGAQFTDWIYKR